MASSARPPVPPLAATDLARRLQEALRARADAAGQLSFAAFMDVALYTPEAGYYRRNRVRVGRGAGTDFYTATSVGPLFGELLTAAAVQLLRAAGFTPEQCTFVELGVEPGGGVQRGAAHPFAAVEELRIGDALAPALARAGRAGPCVVFSNELFDAQPLHRLVWRDGAWRERGVQLAPDDDLAALRDCELPALSAALAAIRPRLPTADVSEGSHLDVPLAAAQLAATIAAVPWTGLFLACDYGKSWRELCDDTPQGTVRAYHAHRQKTALLATPGEQDLTGHICWDWLADELTATGFVAPRVESQEAFFVKHAGDQIGALVAAEATRVSTRKLALMSLLHPANLGQKFQVLHAVRGGR